MIALTLLIGGISLLISSVGTEYVSEAEYALRTQQFEFFTTAFLMMIAFYFGDRSLKYLRDRWKYQPAERTEKPQPTPEPKDGAHGFEEDERMIAEDDLEFMEDDEKYAEEPEETPSPITSLKKKLSPSPPEEIIKTTEYVQIFDNVFEKVLNDKLIEEALIELTEKDNIILSLPVIKAVIEVESSGRGHLKDGRPKILFEGHKFWHWLKQYKTEDKKPEKLVAGNEDILYEKWTRNFYKGGTKEYDRLERARALDEKAAIYSASWGLFQILGENLEHHIKSRNYKDVKDFEEKQQESEYFHFLDFLAFIKDKKLKGKPLIHYISENDPGNYDWASFAYGYNGSGYAVNKYDVKLKAAYERHKNS